MSLPKPLFTTTTTTSFDQKPVQFNPTTSYQQRLSELASAIDAYNGQVDGGNSPDLEAEINYSTPWHPSYYLRDLLLGNAPLSDHILYEAIHRAQPMDPWHLTQVLIQNSPLTGFIRQELESSGVLNAFFLNLLSQFNNGVSLRRLLEREIILRGEQKSRVQHNLIDQWASDTVTEGRLDTIDMILALDTFGLAERYRYWLALERGDNVLAGQIQASFASDPNAASLVQLGDLYTTLAGTWEDATASQVQELTAIAYSGLDGSAHAWSILLELDELDSLPPAILPEMFRAAMPTSGDRNNSASEIQFAAYPNPASTQVMITLPLGAENGELQVFDAQGRSIRNLALSNYKGFITLPLQGWAEGLYLARLDLDGFVGCETKFTVVR